MKRLSRLLALLLAVVLTLGLAGCNSGDLTWVYKLDGETMPAGVYINYLINAYSEGASELLEQEQMIDDLTGTTDRVNELYDMKASQVMRQELGEGTVADWMNERARTYALRYFAAEKLFQENGLVLDGDALAEIASDVEVYMSYYGALYETNGVAESSVRLTFESEQKKQMLFEHLYGPGGEYEVPAGELKEMMAESYALGQSLTFTKATEYDEVDDGSTVDERNERVRTGANEYLQRLKDGDSFELLTYEREVEVAEANGEDAGAVTQAEPGDLNFVVGHEDEYLNYYSQDLIDAMFDASVGQPVLVETDYAFYLVNRLDITQDEELFAEQRSNILHNHSYEAFSDMLDELGATLDLTVNQAAVDKYKAGWLKLD